ncbi:hypothetical protein D7V95_02535 [bacterium J10(2018)]|nr:hypothetical protein D7V95_02535 [bacterium J10(2018)]
MTFTYSCHLLADFGKFVTIDNLSAHENRLHGPHSGRLALIYNAECKQVKDIVLYHVMIGTKCRSTRRYFRKVFCKCFTACFDCGTKIIVGYMYVGVIFKRHLLALLKSEQRIGNRVLCIH